MWFTVKNNFVELRIFLKPNARKTEIIAVNEDELTISVTAKPIKGAANKMLLSYLSGLLKLCKNELHLLRGDTNRHKKVSIPLTEKIKRFIENPIGFISNE